VIPVECAGYARRAEKRRFTPLAKFLRADFHHFITILRRVTIL